MADRVHVTMELELFVEDQDALRQAAYERMQSAWTSKDDFPFESASDVPLVQAIQSLLADALPIEFAGARRSRLSIETDDVESDSDDSRDDQDETSDNEEGAEAGDGSEDGSSSDGSKDSKDNDDERPSSGDR